MPRKKNPDIGTEPKGATPRKPDKTVRPVDRWKSEIDKALKDQEYFVNRGQKIVKRYRDERKAEQENERKFNLLWSNVQTLGPALYSRPPKVVVSRRFNDADKVGRVASLILERGVEYELEKYDIGACMRPAVQDRLLPGRGCGWVRYEPHMQTVLPTIELKKKDQFVDSQGASVSEDAEYFDGEGNAYGGRVEDREGVPTGFGEPYQQKEWECTPLDYVHWQDFLTNPSRTWEEVRWGARRTYPSRDQLVKRFGEKIGSAIPLTARPKGYDEKDPIGQEIARAEVWEIWDRETECVYWIATGYDEFCDHREDPLEIEGFFPFPKPIFATTTTDSLTPVADYSEYQDQALELDDLTQRISKLTEAVKVVGLYDKSTHELQRLLQDGVENRMIAVDNWAVFAEKGGIAGQVSFLPLKEVIEALQTLYNARSQVLSDVYQITGMADIVRGASNPNETATAQQIKGKYANLRLSDLQMDVERFARDLIRIKAEIMAEQYSPETLITISGIMQTPEFSTPPPEIAKAPQPPQPTGDANQDQQAQQQYQQAAQQQQQALMQWQQGNQQVIQEAIQLLKSPQMRDLRIDVETQSMIQMDEEADKASRAEFITAIGGFINQAGQMMQVAPSSGPMMGEFLRFAARGFRVGRELEATIDRFIESMQGAGQQQDPKQAQAQQQEKEKAAQEKFQVEKDKMTVQKDGEMIPLKQKNAEQAIEIKGLRIMDQIKDLVNAHGDHVRGLVEGAKQKPETLGDATAQADESHKDLIAQIAAVVQGAGQPQPAAPQ